MLLRSSVPDTSQQLLEIIVHFAFQENYELIRTFRGNSLKKMLLLFSVHYLESYK